MSEEILSLIKEVIEDRKLAIKYPLNLSNPKSVTAVCADVQAYLLSHKDMGSALELKLNRIEELISAPAPQDPVIEPEPLPEPVAPEVV